MRRREHDNEDEIWKIQNESFDKILHEEIVKFEAESSRHKKEYRVCQTATIVVMAASSVLAAATSVWTSAGPILSVLTAAASSIALAISAWLQMRKSFDLWMTETQILHTLNDIKRSVQFERINGTWNAASMHVRMHDISATIKEGGDAWKHLRRK